MSYKKLKRNKDQRKALLKNLTTAFLRDEKIETTEAKAKEVSRLAEKMITLAKKNTLASRRQALSYLTDEDVVTKLFENIGPKFQERQGGYTRVLKKGPRQGDGAPMAILELVE
ncbi:50S ribosomal protein L17 [Natranaerobius thermophilus]|uniref:Large ribosomal subunit protein bL17 n=1 Tax=Natranaerobius thermophilus (strain ATCC BAA-1301 / DSM 18059 / JW/NM-WN-LF) TaxID=457570 RepID=RL17_NATTJ|nr:50S ribosomal protein L17 [Natranaerobius thermophilus]B2A4Q1.1 RecName: Full=Large ribosomal subunit protein bL17; AltName: Full=50S ribosomal protein L17 [Natranaerobius thermophilus JW/NM-WN-LF]ACB83823.1 LSU ribosomal protein L17P [Natranaerobius thermophilus JW/NM-WN-LF]